MVSLTKQAKREGRSRMEKPKERRKKTKRGREIKGKRRGASRERGLRDDSTVSSLCSQM